MYLYMYSQGLESNFKKHIFCCTSISTIQQIEISYKVTYMYMIKQIAVIYFTRPIINF